MHFHDCQQGSPIKADLLQSSRLRELIPKVFTRWSAQALNIVGIFSATLSKLGFLKVDRPRRTRAVGEKCPKRATLGNVTTPTRMAVAGIGRMGALHALHIHELATEGACRLVAIADVNRDRADNVIDDIGLGISVYGSVEELAAAHICDAVVLATPTDLHRQHAATLIQTGHRVLLEKPLTGTLEGDREFVKELDLNYPDAVMLAFQRRFDAPLLYARQLLKAGAIGRAIKIFSALEDSAPAPDGYRSGGILTDMSIHNVDEILWLIGRMPSACLAVGSRVYSHQYTTAEEDFDDALLCMWFDDGTLAQVQVSRNHVSGYRVETVIFGETGQIHVGRFEGNRSEVAVSAYGKRGRLEPIAQRTFPLRAYSRPVPEFVNRFGSAYKREVSEFIDCCRTGSRFPTTHHDGLRAQQVVSAAMAAVLTSAEASTIGHDGP